MLVLDEAAANFSTLSLEEGESHASSDQKGVYAAQKSLQNDNLARNLRSAHHGYRGLLLGRQNTVHVFDFIGHYVAKGATAFKVLRNHCRRGVGAVRGSESVVHIGVAQFRQLRGKVGIPGFFARKKPNVFHEKHLAVIERHRGGHGFSAHSVG